MLSIPTQLMLCSHLKLIAETEQETEIIRQVLSEQNDFDSSQAFLLITGKKSLNTGLFAENIHDFLNSHSVQFNKKEITKLLKTYDSENNGYLSFLDFLTLILPCSSQALRHINQELTITKDPSLSYESLWGLIRIFEKLLINQKKIHESLIELKSRFDFTINDFFNSIDIEELNYIDADSIFNFFQKNKQNITDNQILSIFRKIDKDQDAKITLKEFEDEINELGVYHLAKNFIKSPQKKKIFNSASKNKSDKKIYSSNKKSNKKESLNMSTPPKSRFSPEKDLFSNSLYEKSIQNGSPERVSASKRRLYKNYKFNDADSDLKLNNIESIDSLKERIKQQEMFLEEKNINISRSPLKTPVKSDNENQNRNYDQTKILQLLKIQIELDKELENTRNELALQSDFNLLDAFKWFDAKGNGYIGFMELEKCFKSLDIWTKEDDLFIFLRKFDKNEDNCIKYSDFCEIFTPKTTEYHHILNNRTPISSQKNVIFERKTKVLIKKTIEEIIKNEKICNDFKEQINNTMFSIENAFIELDKNSNGFISIDEFRYFLEKYKIKTNTTDLINLMKRYDKNRDGKVTYNEFIKEITPKKLN